MGNFDIVGAFIRLLIFIPAVGLHEYCHAKFADMAGDLTPRAQGRVTLNPIAHLDPVGTIMMVLSSVAGVGIGWGKPVMVNVSKMKNPRWDHFISVIMGPVSNLGQALFYALILRFHLVPVAVDTEGYLMTSDIAIKTLPNFLSYWCTFSLFMNVGMFVFNMIPIGPLDGHWLVGSFMEPIMRRKWYAFCHGPGMWIFLALVLLPNRPLRYVTTPIMDFIISKLLGGV
jgi:Zn-dependent protease